MLGILAGVWTGGWFALRPTVEARLDMAEATLDAEGHAFSHRGRSITGFPFRYDVRWSRPVLTLSDRTTLSASALTARAGLLTRRATVRLPADIELVLRDGDRARAVIDTGVVTIGDTIGGSARALTLVSPGRGDVTLEARDLSFTPSTAALEVHAATATVRAAGPAVGIGEARLADVTFALPLGPTDAGYRLTASEAQLDGLLAPAFAAAGTEVRADLGPVEIAFEADAEGATAVIEARETAFSRLGGSGEWFEVTSDQTVLALQTRGAVGPDPFPFELTLIATPLLPGGDAAVSWFPGEDAVPGGLVDIAMTGEAWIEGDGAVALGPTVIERFRLAFVGSAIELTGRVVPVPGSDVVAWADLDLALERPERVLGLIDRLDDAARAGISELRLLAFALPPDPETPGLRRARVSIGDGMIGIDGRPLAMLTSQVRP